MHPSSPSSSVPHDARLHDDIPSDDLPRDVASSSHVTGAVKRSLEAIQEGDNTRGLPSAKKMRLTDDPRLPRIKGCSQVIELMRDDAFPLGLQARAQYEMQLLRELDVEMPDDDDNDLDLVRLNRAQTRDIESVKETKSEKLASQLATLYDLLIRMGKATHPDGRKVLAFAHQIIECLPDIDTEMDLDEEIEEKYLEMAHALISNLPVDDPEAETRRLAFQLQRAEHMSDDNDIEMTDDEDSRDMQEELALQRMGHLLLLSQHDIEEAARCASFADFEDGLEEMGACNHEIIEQAKARISAHVDSHRSVAIQNHEEAAFHQISIEMANLLLLDGGTLNFGIINVLLEEMFPDSWKELESVKTVTRVLGELAQDPMTWREIASVNVPQFADNPSCLTIRTCLGLKHDQEITRRHAQIFVLSAVLGHYRQAKVGSCFATACLIKALHHHLVFFIRDLKQLTEEGKISRIQFGELRHFPYHARVTKEFLDTQIEVDNDGNVVRTMAYDLKPYEYEKWAQPTGGPLYQSPGILAVCEALKLDNPETAVKSCLAQLPSRFATEDLIKLLAKHAYQQQESSRYHFRSAERFTEEHFLVRAELAFGVQTNHPLHRAYEQVAASMVNYFGSQYLMPAWIYQGLESVLEGADKGHSQQFQIMYKQLFKEVFLPMVTRLRFRYNPHIDDILRLFDDGNYGRHDNHFYGYEACDAGLPADFEYSTDLWRDYHAENSYVTLQRFKEYPPEHTWKTISNEESFVLFLQDVVRETTEHLCDGENAHTAAKWNAVAEKMIADMASPTFGRKLICQMMGKDSDQKKEYNKNPFTIMTTPWKFGWGGDFNEVMKTYFGFGHSPSRMKPYNGTPKEVLSKCINFVKKQPDHLREDLDEEPSLHLITSPVHAFLLKTDEPSFQAAWKSEESTNDYIARVVEAPGVAVANSVLNVRQRNEMLKLIAENLWVSAYDEKDDFERQQLTDASKAEFDRLVSSARNLGRLSVTDFIKELASITAHSRAADPKIGKRNAPWEGRCERSLRNYAKTLVAENRMDMRVQRGIAEQLINFARNRKDTLALSPTAVQAFIEKARAIPNRLSVQEFRSAAIQAACEAHRMDVHRNDSQWKEKLCEEFDTKLFTVLPMGDQQKLIQSGIVTHDPNWKNGIYDYRSIFMVNPGTGKIEFCKYLPDLQSVRFMEQDAWFPRKQGGHGYWEFPENYRVYDEQPFFNVRKHMDL